MKLRPYIDGLVVVVLVFFVLALLLGAALGQPILLGYVETNSMQPAMDPGDGFVSIPQQLAGPVQQGDVIVYQAEKLHDGGLTTHRVVAENDKGYITKGDANSFTDQDRKNEPPVKDAQIVGKALQINGHLVVIPHLGDVVVSISTALQTVQRALSNVFGTSLLLGTNGLAYLLFAVSFLYYVLSGVGRRNSRNRNPPSRSNRETGFDARLIVALFTLLVVVGATLPMVVPGGTQEYGVVSAEFDSEQPTVIPVGQSDSLQRQVANDGILPVIVYHEPASEEVEVRPRELGLESGEIKESTVTLHAADRTGYHRRFVTQHRYLAVLPRSTIRYLYHFHPWAPIVVIDVLIGVPFYLFGVGLVGTGHIRNQSRSRGIDGLTRLRRVFRKLY